MVRMLIPVLCTIALVACGGGGGGSSEGNSSGERTPFQPDNYGEVAVTKDNVTIMASTSLSVADRVAMLNRLVSDALDIVISENDGESVVSCLRSGTLSIIIHSSSTLSIQFNQCSPDDSGELFDGKLTLATESFPFFNEQEFIFRGEIIVASDFKLGDIYTAGDSSYALTYQRSFNGKLVTASFQNSHSLLLNNNISLDEGSITYELDYDINNYFDRELHISFDLALVSAEVNGRYRCYTAFPITGTSNSKFHNGIEYNCASSGSSIANIVRNSLVSPLAFDINLQDTTSNSSSQVGSFSDNHFVYLFRNMPSLDFDFSPRLELLSGTKVKISNNDIAYSSYTKSLIVSAIAENDGDFQGIAEINPISGEILSQLSLDSEPGILSVSEDGETLYVGLKNDHKIEKINLATFSVENSFSLPTHVQFGNEYPTYAWDIAVSPLDNNLIAVSLSVDNETTLHEQPARVSLFRNGSELPDSYTDFSRIPNNLEFSKDGLSLYGNWDLSTGVTQYLFSVTTQGISLTSTLGNFDYGFGDVILDNDLILSNSGNYYDYFTKEMVGQFRPVYEYYRNATQTLITHDQRHVYRFFNVLEVFDKETFTHSNSYTVDLESEFKAMVSLGDSHVAFSSNEEILIVDNQEIKDSNFACGNSDFVTQENSNISNHLYCVFSDSVYDSTRSKIYASLPGAAGKNGNSIAIIDVETLAIEEFIPVGSEPTKLALSDDKSTLFVGFKGETSYAKLSTETRSITSRYQLGSPDSFTGLFVEELLVLPNSNDSVILKLGNQVTIPSYEFVSVFTNGIEGQNRYGDSAFEPTVGLMSFIDNNTILSYNNASTGFEMVLLKADSLGPIEESIHLNLFDGFAKDFVVHGTMAYSSLGDVINTESMTLVGSFGSEFVIGAQGKVIAIDTENNAILVYSNLIVNGIDPAISAYDLNSFNFLGSFQLPALAGGLADPIAIHIVDSSHAVLVLNSGMYMIETQGLYTTPE